MMKLTQPAIIYSLAWGAGAAFVKKKRKGRTVWKNKSNIINIIANGSGHRAQENAGKVGSS